MTLDSHLYGNPEIVLMHKQQAAQKRVTKCAQCAHHQSIQIGTDTHHGCTLKRRNWQACTYFQQQGSK